MENEIFDCIYDSYKDDITELIQILLFLRNNTTNKKLQKTINNFVTENHFCLECGQPLNKKIVKEYHTELDYPCYEVFVEEYCENCGFIL